MKYITAENPGIRIFIQYTLPFLLIGIISRTFPLTGSLYYIVPVILIINILLAIITIPPIGKTLSHFLIIFVFPVYCLISSIWSLYPIISLQRSLYLLLLYAGILSSVLLYKKFFPEKGIGFLIPANIMILILSAVSLIFGIPVDRWTGGNGLGFMGFAGHQNILGAALLFTLPGLLGYKTKDKGTKIYVERIFYFLFLSFNFFLLIITYSRASLFAFGIGIITYLLITRSKRILAILLTGFTLLFVLYLTITPLKNGIDYVLKKNSGNILDRRTVLWNPSFEAAKLGGFFGLGYGVSAPGIKTPISTGSHYEDGKYVREKGNSVLAIVEETGLIGLLLFLLPIFYIVINRFKSPNSLIIHHSSLLTAALAAMLVHAQFEGWWVGVGSIHLPIFYIILFITLSRRMEIQC